MGFSHDHLRLMFLKTAGLLEEIQRLCDCDPKLHEFTATVVGDLSQRSVKKNAETWCKHGPGNQDTDRVIQTVLPTIKQVSIFIP